MTTVISPQDDRHRPSGRQKPPIGDSRVEPLTAADEAAVLALLTRCSRTTLFRRFHSFTDGRAYARDLFSARPGYHSLVARNGPVCIGIGNLARDATSSADLAVLVEDDWQRRGVGSRLIWALLDTARSHGVATVHADLLSDSQFLLRALHRAGPLTVAFQTGTLCVDIDLGRGRSEAPVQ
jgi:GNAT superfamily N-acetyltransferase